MPNSMPVTKKSESTIAIDDFWDPKSLRTEASKCRVFSLFAMVLMAFAFLVSWLYYVHVSVRVHEKYERLADVQLDIVDAGKDLFDTFSKPDFLEKFTAQLGLKVADRAAAPTEQPATPRSLMRDFELKPVIPRLGPFRSEEVENIPAMVNSIHDWEAKKFDGHWYQPPGFNFGKGINKRSVDEANAYKS